MNINFKHPNISYIVAESQQVEAYLYSREYQILELDSYLNGAYDKSLFAFTNLDNNEIRKNALHILSHFNEDSLIIKYKGDNNAKRIKADGSERPMSILVYNTDSSNKSYIYEGLSVSFVEKQLYSFPKEKKDLKNGMVVEYLNKDNNWVNKKILNINEEYENFYKLMIKYGKVRLPI